MNTVQSVNAQEYSEDHLHTLVDNTIQHLLQRLSNRSGLLINYNYVRPNIPVDILESVYSSLHQAIGALHLLWSFILTFLGIAQHPAQ